MEWKNCCSPAVNTNWFPQSPHITSTSTKFMTRSRTDICFEKLTIVWTCAQLPVNEQQDQSARPTGSVNDLAHLKAGIAEFVRGLRHDRPDTSSGAQPSPRTIARRGCRIRRVLPFASKRATSIHGVFLREPNIPFVQERYSALPLIHNEKLLSGSLPLVTMVTVSKNSPSHNELPGMQQHLSLPYR